MASFENEQGKTAGKMSDLVMESISQYIARDFLEAYEKGQKEDIYEYAPAEFDEKIYKKIAKLMRKKTGSSKKLFRKTALIIAAAVSLFCIAFTIAVLSNNALRYEIFSLIGIN